MIEPLQLDMYEEWKPIEGHEDYMISTKGRCYVQGRILETKGGWSQFWNGGLLAVHNNGNGYLAYEIQGKRMYAHRLVALAFIPNPENKPDVDHIDGNRANNSVENLRWATRSENMRNPNTHPKMSEVQIKKVVVMLDADGKYLCEAKGIPVMSNICGLPKNLIKNCATRKSPASSLMGFQFMYKENYDPQKDNSYISNKYIGYDYVINERAFVVFSCGRLCDVFPSVSKAARHYGISRGVMGELCNTHKCISKKITDKLPYESELYLYKDLDDVKKEEVKKFYRKKYPIPDILNRYK